MSEHTSHNKEDYIWNTWETLICGADGCDRLETWEEPDGESKEVIEQLAINHYEGQCDTDSEYEVKYVKLIKSEAY